MKPIFTISYAALWAIVFVQTAMLQEVVRRTARIKRLYMTPRRRTALQQLTTGTLAPEFVGQALGSGHVVRTSDLKGHSTILLFVSPSDTSSSHYEKLSAGTHALWHKADGHLYVICSGGAEECHRIMRDHHVEGVNLGRVPIILDENGKIAANFLVGGTPQAVILDKETRVTRYGHPSIDGEARDARQ
jgi:hypothetical protein